MTWEPANELRWKVILTPSSNLSGGPPRKNALLQQQWALKLSSLDGFEYPTQTEWRDVPTEEVGE